MTIDFKALVAEFPREAISWRPQGMYKQNGGWVAGALAYVDSRDVQDRLDAVAGSQNWQTRYEQHGAGTTLCCLSIRINGEWVTKTDGAGETKVEGEKGAISDSLKRAAVQWGIARYLYNLKGIYVPCEVSNKGGKDVFKKWSTDPWQIVDKKYPNRSYLSTSIPLEIPVVKKKDPTPGIPVSEEFLSVVMIEACENPVTLYKQRKAEMAELQETQPKIYDMLLKAFKKRKQQLSGDDHVQS